MERRNAEASPIIISVSHSRSNSAKSISGQMLPLDNDMQRPGFLKVGKSALGPFQTSLHPTAMSALSP